MITVTFEWTVEEVADVARRYFDGNGEYEWVNNWTQEDEDDFASRMKSVLNYKLTEKFENMVERYVREEFTPEDPEYDDDAGIQICPKCGASCKDDQTIKDHGCCIDCFHEREENDDEGDWTLGEDKNVGL